MGSLIVNGALKCKIDLVEDLLTTKSKVEWHFINHVFVYVLTV